MAVAIVSRRPHLRVVVDGQLVPSVLGARTAFGLDQQTAEAQVQCPLGVPSWVMLESRISVIMGATTPTARQRFTGYVSGFEPTMWPGDIGIVASGPLYRAAITYGDGRDLGGTLDSEAVVELLEASGITDMDVGGLNETLGEGDGDDERFVWSADKSALSMIEDIDLWSAGYRTYDTPGGTVRRRWITSIPGSAYAYTFTEGVDIISGSARINRKLQPRNSIAVSGWDGVTGSASAVNPTISAGGGTLPLYVPSRMIGLVEEADRLAAYVLAERNRTIIDFTFATPLDHLLEGGMTVYTDAPERLKIQQVAWVKRVETEITEADYTATLNCTTDLGRSERNPGIGNGGEPVENPIPEPTEPPPAPADGVGPIDPGDGGLIADFVIVSIEKERVIIGGVATDLYTVLAEDATVPASGTVSTRSWSASAGAKVASGTEVTFITAWEAADYATAAITLDIEDDLGNTGTIEKLVSQAGASAPKVRKLYTAATADIEAFDGSQWRTAAPASDADVVGNGPLWGAGTAALASTDDLATAPISVTPFFASADVTALWAEVDVSTERRAAGGSNGRVSVSIDGGVIWAEKAGPTLDPVLKIILSRNNQDEIHVLNDSGWYQSVDNGDSWNDVLWSPVTGQTPRDLELSHSRNVIASEVTGSGSPLEKAEDHTPFTFPTLSPPVTDVVSVFAHIRADRFACIDAEGRTFVTEEDGGTAMVQAEDIPAGTSQPRGGYRDGDMPGLLYFAVGADGVYKSLDFFGSSGGFQQLRAAGIDGAGSGPWPMVGAGELVLPPGVVVSAEGVFIGTAFGAYAYSVADDTWSDITPDAGDDNIVGIAAVSGHLWAVSDTPTLWHSTDDGVSWTPVALPGDPNSCDTLNISGSVLLAVVNDASSTADNGIWSRPVDGSGSWTQIYATGSDDFVWSGDIVGARLWFPRNSGATRHFHFQTPVSGGVDTDLSITGVNGTAVALRGEPADATVAYACIAFDPSPGLGHLYRIDGTTPTDVTPGVGTNVGPVDAASNGAGVLLAKWNAGATSTIYRSTDRGDTWTTVKTGSASANDWPAIGWSAAGGVAVAWGPKIALSTDAGLTWTESANAPEFPNALAAP